MAFSLRLPPALEADARARCERLGISLNALVCVALDAYLRAPSQPAAPAAAQHPAESREAAGLVSVSTTCTTPLEAPAACVAAPVSEPVPAPVPRQKPVLTAPPLAAPVPPPVAVAPALSRAERRRLERPSKKR